MSNILVELLHPIGLFESDLVASTLIHKTRTIEAIRPSHIADLILE